jgi:molybdopterin/thiamine biosynthesis adenylyltransferase
MQPDEREKIRGLVAEKSAVRKDPAGRSFAVLSDRAAQPIAERCGCPLKDVYREALAAGIYPHRYVRNRDIIPPESQLKLAESRVAVVGAGGLGGHVILLLARMGIGTLVVLDHDVFDESNLNRQALSGVDAVGRPKAATAVSAVASVNPGVEVVPHVKKLSSENAVDILKGCDVAVDALDSVADRFVLEDGARKLRIPLVHGALAGFEGQLMTVFPEDEGLILLYGSREANIDKASSPEAVLGVPTITPAVVASLEAMEVVKILLNRGRLFRNKLVHVDLETGRLNEFLFSEEGS